MKIKFLPKAEKAYTKLPKTIQSKTRKTFEFLIINPDHPSLRIRKMKGYTDIWEERIDRNYRIAFLKESATYIILSIGPHDKGLGIK